jgi:hypothetical protein
MKGRVPLPVLYDTAKIAKEISVRLLPEAPCLPHSYAPQSDVLRPDYCLAFLNAVHSRPSFARASLVSSGLNAHRPSFRQRSRSFSPRVVDASEKPK